MVYKKRNKIKGRKISLTPDADRTPRRADRCERRRRRRGELFHRQNYNGQMGFAMTKQKILQTVMLWKTTPILDSKWQIWTGRRSGINTLSERWVKTSLTMTITYFE